MKRIVLLFLLLCYNIFSFSQTALEIITKSDDKMRGETSYSEIIISAVRSKWSKDMKLVNWTKGSDYSVSLVKSPAKEKGTVFLKRKAEVWNYIPSIERNIKLPPSMMMQGWMGTDLTNDDMVKQSSIVVDYSHNIIGLETIQDLDCWKIELIPIEDAPVVWGRIIMWVDKSDYIQMKAEFYDEDSFLINKLLSYNIKNFDGKKLPSKMEFIPVEKKGQKTIIEYLVWKFGVTIPDKYFTSQYMKRLK